MIAVTLYLANGTQDKVSFYTSEVLVGRTDDNDIVLAGENVSMHHARLVMDGSQLVITDLKSTNGTFVNGRKLSAPHVVGVNDTFSIGGFLLKAEIEENPK